MGQRVVVPRFVGGSNRLFNPNASNEVTINYFLERTLSGVKGELYLRRTEGFRLHAHNPAVVDVTAQFAQDGRAWGVCQNVYFEFLDGGTIIPIGIVAYDGNPAFIVSNGSGGGQNAICSGGHYYVHDLLTDAFAEVVIDAGIDVAMIEYLDGYILALERDTTRFYFSAINDAATFDPLDFYDRIWGSDNIAFIKRSGRQLWVGGTKTTEIWGDNGQPLNPFAPIQGVFLDRGCISGWTAQRDGDGLTWLQGDERGGGVVVRATGYQPDMISTNAISTKIQDAAFRGQADPGEQDPLRRSEGLTWQVDGHTFYALNVPTLKTTPVFDFTLNQWHERADWNYVTATWERWFVRSHCFAFERHYVGSRTQGAIWEMSPYFLENLL